jgi:hypothetical protein
VKYHLSKLFPVSPHDVFDKVAFGLRIRKVPAREIQSTGERNAGFGEDGGSSLKYRI